MYITASDTINTLVEFKGPSGQLVVPDAGTFSYSIYDLAGNVLLATTTPTLGTTATETVITLGSPTTDTEGTFTVKYQYDVDSTTYIERRRFTVIADPKYIVTLDDVRNSLGASEAVLPDGMINLYETYSGIKNGSDVGDIDFDAALIGGGYSAQLANQAIKYKAACEALSIMSITLIKTHTEDNISLTHFEADLGALKGQLSAKYYAAIGELNPALSAQLLSVSDLFIVATPDPDPVTGETVV